MSQEIAAIHIPFRRWLDGEKWLAYSYHRPDRATGATLGDADFIIYTGPGFCLHLEAKDKGTPISASQKKRHAELAAIGITVHVFRDVGTGVTLVSEWRSMLGKPLTPTPSGAPTVIYGGRKYREVNGELLPV